VKREKIGKRRGGKGDVFQLKREEKEGESTEETSGGHVGKKFLGQGKDCFSKNKQKERKRAKAQREGVREKERQGNTVSA